MKNGAAVGDPDGRLVLNHGGWVTGLSMAADRLAVVDRDGGLSLWQRPFGQAPAVRFNLERAIDVALSPTARWLAAAGSTGLAVFDLTP